MQRRSLLNALAGLSLLALGLSGTALADGLGAISGADASAGLKEALTRGASLAVDQLGKENGFLGDARVKIPLPDALEKAEKLLRTMGKGKDADELVTRMNRAAESAVAEAKPILVNAVKGLTVSDAKEILTGGEDSVTQFFRRSTESALTAKFLPIVHKATDKVQLADTYDRFAGQAARLRLIDDKDAKLDDYVTRKALDGLFLMIAEQEKSIRQDPVGTGSKLLGKVFGAIGH